MKTKESQALLWQRLEIVEAKLCDTTETISSLLIRFNNVATAFEHGRTVPTERNTAANKTGAFREKEVHLEESDDQCEDLPQEEDAVEDSSDDTDAEAKEPVKAPAKETGRKRKVPSARKKGTRKAKMDAVEDSLDDADQETKEPVKAPVKKSAKKRKVPSARKKGAVQAKEESEEDLFPEMDAGSDNAYAESENEKTTQKAKKPDKTPARKRSSRAKK
ncbi:hypothetical protein B0H13DRAFT_2542834 [Mycena leptocephala]|nr:hypothetical protein B0H13DRAFT_2542834 [Mycena leptocephala]